MCEREVSLSRSLSVFPDFAVTCASSQYYTYQMLYSVNFVCRSEPFVQDNQGKCIQGVCENDWECLGLELRPTPTLQP